MAGKSVKYFGRGRVNPVSTVSCWRLFHVGNLLTSKAAACLPRVFPRAAFPCLCKREVLPCKCFLNKTWLLFNYGTMKIKNFCKIVCWSNNSTKRIRVTVYISKYSVTFFTAWKKQILHMKTCLKKCLL